MMRVAAIDVGSNSLRLMVGEEVDGILHLLGEYARTTRLGRGISTTGILSSQSMRHSLRALNELLEAAKSFGVSNVRLSATEALRKARNRKTFIDLVRRRTGFELEVLSAEHEATLTFSAVRQVLSALGPLTVFDIGGSSTEVAGGPGLLPVHAVTYDLGCITLKESHLPGDPPGEKAWREALIYSKRVLSGVPRTGILVGCGGAFTSAAAFRASMPGYNRIVRGQRLDASWITTMGEWFSSLTEQILASLPGISPARAPLATAGMAIIGGLLTQESDWCLVSDRGMAWGLLLETWRSTP